MTKEKEKHLRLKEKEKKEKEKKEKEQSNFVSGYANYAVNSPPIKSWNDNPLYNQNIYVDNNKKKKN